MNQFKERKPDVRENQIYRDTLLAQPPEFFQKYFSGQNPSLIEKIHLVERIVQISSAAQTYINDTYRVLVRHEPPFVHLNISRLDGKPGKSWRDFQQIKNELVGPEFEAVELFPAESRLVDTDNEYHLWVNTQPGYRFPLGYQTRLVLDAPVVYRGRAGEFVEPGNVSPFPVDSGAALAARA